MKGPQLTGILFGLFLLLSVCLYVTGYGAHLAGMAFFNYQEPDGVFDPEQAVDAPDYNNVAFWAALPTTADPADLVPAGIAAGSQGERPIDTFFIHPTGFLTSGSWTSPMNPDSGTEENTQWMMANQASAYNGCCNIYAPRYREANIFVYFSADIKSRDAVLDFAYQDVKRSFEYFIEHYNEGRPFIIASHSQGTHHAIRLLKEVVDRSDLHKRMVAAYIIGSTIIPVSPDWFDAMANISPCESAEDLHCVVHWDTMPEGASPMERPEPSLCTNPLTWKVNEEMAPATLNAGAVAPAGIYNATFGRKEDSAIGQVFDKLAAPVKSQTWAQCRGGSLFAKDQAGTRFFAMGSNELNTYHGLDYALFYMNIRNNAVLKSNLFIERTTRRTTD